MCSIDTKWPDKHRPGPQTCCASLLWRGKTSTRNYLSACLSLSDPHNDLSAYLSVYLSVFIIICIFVHLNLTLSDFYLDLFVLLSTCVSSCLSLPACSFMFCHTDCLPFSLSSPVLAFRLLSFVVWLRLLVSLYHRFMCALLLRSLLGRNGTTFRYALSDSEASFLISKSIQWKPEGSGSEIKIF